MHIKFAIILVNGEYCRFYISISNAVYPQAKDKSWEKKKFIIMKEGLEATQATLEKGEGGNREGRKI